MRGFVSGGGLLSLRKKLRARDLMDMVAFRGAIRHGGVCVLIRTVPILPHTILFVNTCYGTKQSASNSTMTSASGQISLTHL